MKGIYMINTLLNLITGGGGGHSNTSVVHMHDQRFSKHTLYRDFPF